MDINLRHFYTMPDLYVLLDMKFRMQIKRWLHRRIEADKPITILYVTKGLPMYLRKDVDDYLFEYGETNPLLKWTIAKKQLATRRIDLNLNEWLNRKATRILLGDLFGMWGVYAVTRTHTSMVKIRTRWVEYGDGRRQLFFLRKDVEARAKLTLGYIPELPDIYHIYRGIKQPEYKITLEEFYEHLRT